MATIPELLDGHVTLEVECLDRLYLNGYIGPLATAGGLVTFIRGQLGKPIPCGYTERGGDTSTHSCKSASMSPNLVHLRYSQQQGIISDETKPKSFLK
jgi:hypothetical protein